MKETAMSEKVAVGDAKGECNNIGIGEGGTYQRQNPEAFGLMQTAGSNSGRQADN